VTKKLMVGIALWVAAVAMTPHEIAAAKAYRPIDARTVATFASYLAAALLVLAGIRWQPKRARDVSG
jgi:hypothetical protein